MNTPAKDVPLPIDRATTLVFLETICQEFEVLPNNILYHLNYVALLRNLRDFAVREIDRFTEDN